MSIDNIIGKEPEMGRRDFLSLAASSIAGFFGVSTVFGINQPHADAEAPKVFVEDYYKNAKPADEIMPGLRKEKFGHATIYDPYEELILYPDGWTRTYNTNKDLRRIFEEADNREIIVPGTGTKYRFNFEAFNKYWAKSVGSTVAILNFKILASGGGYMFWSDVVFNYILPLDKPIIDGVKGMKDSIYGISLQKIR